MVLKHRVALDGVELDSIDDRIIITKVEEPDGKEQFSAVSLWGSNGSRVTELHRDHLDVTVKFVIRIRKRDMAGREEVLEKVNAWACAGGWLTLNYRENRRIRVFMLQAAGMGDAWDWTREFAVTFRACGVPYWQETGGTIIDRRGINGGTFQVGAAGSAQSVMEVSFRNTSGGVINTFSISCADCSMSFTGLGLANGETFEIKHADNGKRCVLQILAGGRSALACRSMGSSNDLFINPGTKNVTVSAGGNGNLTISCRGRFA